ncbi:unnamed protein product, partial [marine sediment metagenome]
RQTQLEGADLRGSDLRGTRVDPEALSQASITGALLPKGMEQKKEEDNST